METDTGCDLVAQIIVHQRSIQVVGPIIIVRELHSRAHLVRGSADRFRRYMIVVALRVLKTIKGRRAIRKAVERLTA